jgi:hypothetical protein
MPKNDDALFAALRRATNTDLPWWHPQHPLVAEKGTVKVTVETEFADSAPVDVPACLNPYLRDTVAAFRTLTEHRFVEAEKRLPYVIAESIGQLSLDVGGTPEKWRAWLTSIGLPPDPRASNDFVTLLTLMAGGKDPNRYIGRICAYLDAWTRRWEPGPEFDDREGLTWSDDFGWPNPYTDSVPGTSTMTLWGEPRKDMRWGYRFIGEQHAKWLKKRECPSCGTVFVLAEHEICPKCKRPADRIQPAEGDVRVIGFRQIIIDQTPNGEINDADHEECHKEHPDAVVWYAQCFDDGEWIALHEHGICTLAEAEAFAHEARLNPEQYSEPIKVKPAPKPPATTPEEPAPQPSTLPIVVAPGSSRTHRESTFRSKPGGLPPQPDWSGSAGNGSAEPAAAAEEPADEADGDEADEETVDEREPPGNNESWEEVRELYERYGPYEDWERAPSAVRRWLNGEQPADADEQFVFEAMDELGGAAVADLHRVIYQEAGANIGKLLYALEDDTNVMAAIDSYLREAYPAYCQFEDFDALMKAAQEKEAAD